MYVLTDVLDVQRVGEYTTTEDAIMVVGGLMILHGIEMARERYVLSELPNKKGVAKVVYTPQEVWRRALVYFNKDTWQSRRNRWNAQSRK